MQYQTNEATFTLPEGLRDKTVHMFVLNDDGPNDFSIVISRSHVPDTETLDEYVQRLKEELSTALPKFQVLDSAECQYDGYPAMELRYRWSNNGLPMFQHQAVALIKSSEDQHHMVFMVTATCPKLFSEKWDEAFAGVLSSIRIRDTHKLSHVNAADEPLAVSPEEEAQPDDIPANTPHVFALAIRDRVLHVHENEEQACRRVNALEVEDGMWAFFNSMGMPLQAEFTEPNTGKIWRSEGKYRLRSRSLPTTMSLRACIHQIAKVVGSPPFDSVTAIQLHLDRQAGALSAGVDRP
ncbi:DUF1795 domain-containing protein [Noviherbaspirillum sp. CPCC 100848]|uniref:DUF1795 domain-containing protein n=1 Tax=Noviherbaspirillum album TaxID=3080276 RepID=A0ABU6JJH6_9BURK|nr:DUF1795 domain-containing protein [Noviherbaspirillum sp. CPCC 100848]MEC4723842.1 DUF1795 domain-containing protein [Noviherbaspirillum sp. CPCC 100848]